MKVWKIVCFSLCFIAQMFSEEINILESACGSVALTPAHVRGIDSWNRTFDEYIGIEDDLKNLGLNLGQPSLFLKESLSYLTAISFDDFEMMNPDQQLIAEREILNPIEKNHSKAKEVKKINSSIQGIGAPRF